MFLLKSKTLYKLTRLFRFLPKNRLNSFATKIIPLSIVSGLIDIGVVAVSSRLAGSLVGKELKNFLPGIQVFNNSLEEQAIILIFILVILSWLGSASKLFRLIFIEKLTASIWRDISNGILLKITGQPYRYFLTTKTSSISARLLADMQGISDSIIKPILLLLTSIIVIFSISLALSFVLGVKAIILLFLLGIAFFILSSLIVPYLRIFSNQTIRLNSKMSLLLNQILFSIRDIHLTQSRQFFESKFIRVGEFAQRYRWKSRSLPDMPRIVIEPLAITFIFIAALIPFFISSGSEKLAPNLIPFVATFIVSLVKLTPPLQDLFRSITTIRGGLPIIDAVLDYLELPSTNRGYNINKTFTPEGIFPRREISLRNVDYKYPGSDNYALKSISINLPVGSRIALMGPTGSGKSTISNILLAHLDPTSGHMNLDGEPLDDSDISSWQLCCSEVSQNFTLIDANILENIAFGCTDDDVDLDRVWEAISAAQMSDFIDDMPYGLYTYIGENGLNLSGGQRQRLALARAFYRNTKFLILDEATSALDQKTENDVINSLKIIGRRCTTVVIAHRLNTLSKCDYIYEIKDGLLICSGSYDDLCNPNHPLGRSVKV